MREQGGDHLVESHPHHLPLCTGRGETERMGCSTVLVRPLGCPHHPLGTLPQASTLSGIAYRYPRYFVCNWYRSRVNDKFEAPAGVQHAGP